MTDLAVEATNPLKHTWRKPLELFQEKDIVKVCAPMVRYSKLSFRTLVRKYGCDLAFTPMILSESFIKSARARDCDFRTNTDDRPLIVQFAAKNALELADAAEIIAPYVDGVDLNCGCPKTWAMSDGYGAHLLKNPELIRDMIGQTRKRIPDTNFTLSIKIRIHNDLRKTVDLCQKAERAGVSWISVHARTIEQRNQPPNMDAVKIIKNSLQIPIIANGDIKSLEDVKIIHCKTGADGVMAARGILENPAMFAGFSSTPIECIKDWVNIAMSLGTPFSAFHHHLIYMLEHITCRSDRRIFNVLSSTSAVLNYLHEHFDV